MGRPKKYTEEVMPLTVLLNEKELKKWQALADLFEVSKARLGGKLIEQMHLKLTKEETK